MHIYIYICTNYVNKYIYIYIYLFFFVFFKNIYIYMHVYVDSVLGSSIEVKSNAGKISMAPAQGSYAQIDKCKLYMYI